MKVLSFAAVGVHGREWCTRIASRACFVACLAAPVHTQSLAPSSDLEAELAGKIATALTPSDSVAISVPDGDARLRSEMSRLLRARGLSILETRDASADVHVSCGQNLRERVCAAEIRRSGGLQIVAATRARDAAGRANIDPGVGLAVRSLLSRREPILDVAIAGEQMLVLGPEALTLEPLGDIPRLSPSPSAPIAHTRAWPRDLRGRVRTTASGFEAFLPGVTCRGAVKPLAVACTDETSPWPIGLDNSGIAASRNTFSTPEGVTFFGAAPLGPTGRIRWILADQRGVLVFLDETRAVVARGDIADDVARLNRSCAPGTFVVAASRSADRDGGDTLRLFRVSEATLVPMDAMNVPGRVTALWSDVGDPAATVIVRHENGVRYEALHVSLACAR